MAKNFLLKVVILSSIILTHSLAEARCTEVYQELIAVNKSEQVKITAGSVALTFLTILFPPAGVARVGTLMLKGKLTVDGVSKYISKVELVKIEQLLNDAEYVDGPELNALHEIVMSEQPDVTSEWLAQKLLELNESEYLCYEGYVATYEEILGYFGVSEELIREKTKLFNLVNHDQESVVNAQPFSPFPGHQR